jgi:hypothetical protein
LKVPSGLGVVVGVLPPGSVTASNRQPAEPDVVHDHIPFGQHKMVAVASGVVRIGAPHVKDAGTTKGGETVGRSSLGKSSSYALTSEMVSHTPRPVVSGRR